MNVGNLQDYQVQDIRDFQRRDRKFLERWANAYTLCRTIPNDHRFDIKQWGKQENTECGTAACIAGHAALHPWFRRRGLTPEFGIMGDRMDVLNREEVFGYSYESITPFIPGACARLLNLDYIEDRITPKRAAKAVYRYMVIVWGKEDTDTAIEKAEVIYDAAWVHKYTPWNQATG